MLARDQILDRDGPAGPAQPAHLGHNVPRMLEMMDRESAHDDVEFSIAKGQPRLHVAQLEADVAESAFRAHLIGDFQRRLGQIDADHFAAYARKC